MKQNMTALLILLFIVPTSYAVDSHCTGSVGEIAACHLNKAYNNTYTECKQGENPGACSGVVLRGLKSHAERTHRAWDFKAGNAGVSFSYLRKDANFSELAYRYQSGFILAPFNHTPEGQSGIAVRCAFPFDGDSWSREQMCGKDRRARNGYSQPCDQQSPPITTGADWVARFEKNETTPASDTESCGFSIGRNRTTAKVAFNAMLDARNRLIKKHPDYFKHENKLVMETWDLNNVRAIPIEAFFYLSGSEQGRHSAQSDQQDYYHDTGKTKIVPVIAMTLPSSINDTAHFIYHAEDQSIH